MELRLKSLGKTFRLRRFYWEPTDLMLIEGKIEFEEILEINKTRNPFGIFIEPLQLKLSNCPIPNNATWLYFEGLPTKPTFSYSAFVLIVYSDEFFINEKIAESLSVLDLKSLNPEDFDF